MKLSHLPLLLIPGMSQIRGGAPGLGVLFFAVFLLALNGYFLTALLTAEGAHPALGFLALGVWIISMIDGIRRLVREGP